MNRHISRGMGVVVLVSASVAAADTAAIPASKDNTLYESGTGAFSNGKGQYTFCGLTAVFTRRRALFKFDVAAAVPAGSTINSATLRLHMSRTIVAGMPCTLHRVLADWGEGDSLAFGEEGGGGDSQPGDATWIHRFYDTVFWAAPGGDFHPTASATTTVAGIGFYEWTGAQVAADVQGWLDNPASNFGWLLKGVENQTSAKRFDSRENIDPQVRPVLIVDFTPPPPPCEGDYDGDLMVTFGDVTFVLVNFNNPFTFADVTTVLVNFGEVCAF